VQTNSGQAETIATAVGGNESTYTSEHRRDQRIPKSGATTLDHPNQHCEKPNSGHGLGVDKGKSVVKTNQPL